MKLCKKCNTEKEETQFSKDKSRKTGYHSICIECNKISCKKRYEKNKQYYLDYQKKYIKDNKEKVSKKNKKYREDNKEKIKKYNKSINGIYRRIKGSAKSRELDFDISKEYYSLNFFEKECHYCKEQSTGIDRIDSNNGYTVKNSVPCCLMCNEMKLDYHLNDWIQKMKNILEKQGYNIIK